MFRAPDTKVLELTRGTHRTTPSGSRGGPPGYPGGDIEAHPRGLPRGRKQKNPGDSHGEPPGDTNGGGLGEGLVVCFAGILKVV